jgi:hypothetical protein
MKKVVVIIFMAIVCLGFGKEQKPVKDCRCKDTQLYGKVKIVTHHADFDVQIVEHHADLHVLKAKSNPNRCGIWQFVEHHPDFTVRLVEHHPDFTVKYVEHHPGEH